MIGHFLTRFFMSILAYAYPAFECYKTVEKNRVEIEQLRFWCQYWIIIATLTVFERFADTFVSWLPMYGEMKLGFIIYLWYPKIQGTSYVYQTFLRPYIARYEKDIDRNILELRARALDLTSLHLQNCVKYGQTALFQLFQFLAAQSANVTKNTKQEDNSNPSNQPKEQPEKMRPPSVHRMVSEPTKSPRMFSRLPKSPKFEPVQDHPPNKTQSPTKDHKVLSKLPTFPKFEPVQDHSPNETPKKDNEDTEESDITETLRAARTRLRRSNSRPQH